MALTAPPHVADSQVQTAETKKKAAIIDDAFDDVIEGEVSLVQFQEFYQQASETNLFEDALARLSIQIPNITELEDDSDDLLNFLKEIWKHKDDPALRQIINHGSLFADKISKLEQLENLCKNIEENDITVVRFKSKIEDLTVFSQGEFVYIFIDYNLGVKPGDSAIANARKVSKEIYDICPRESKPVTILMSSDPNVDDSKRLKFQKDAGLLEGVFRLSSKSALVDKRKVSLLVRAYREEFNSNHKLQEYIQSLIKAAQSAQREFESEIQTLRVEDYHFIQNGVLQDQKHPLGDYLAWLYGSHWATLLFNDPELRKRQEEIDQVMTEKKPLHHSSPSTKLAQIFMSALFESNLREIEHHPWEGKDQKVAKLPYLHLGDVFTKSGDANVFMILNPQCDLERPDESKQNESILILPGTLENIENKRKSECVTDFFIFEDKQYKIFWKLNQFQTVPLNEFEQWKTQKNLVRNFRLRLPYVLEIQRQYSSNISRVGLPVAPPLSTKIDLEVKYLRYDKTFISLVKKKDSYAFLPVISGDYKASRVRLTLNFALDFKEAIVEEIAQLKQSEQSIKEKNEQMPKDLEKSISKLETFLEKFDDWFFGLDDLKSPAENGTEKGPPSFIVTRNFDGEPQQDSKNQFWIKLSTGIESVETSSESDEKTELIRTEAVTSEDSQKSENKSESSEDASTEEKKN